MAYKFNPFTKKLDYTPVTHIISDGDTENCPDGNSVFDALALKLAKASDLSDVANAATAFGNIKQSATTSATGVVELATQAEVLAGTDTSRAVVSVDLHAKIAVEKNPLSMAQGIAMTYAASGSSGIQVADNDNTDFGTGNFALRWKGSLPDWTPSLPVKFFYKPQDISNRWSFLLDSSRYFWYLHHKTGGTSISIGTLPFPSLVDGTEHEIVAVITRETESSDGSVACYIDGVLIGTMTISAGTPADISNTGVLYMLGDAVTAVKRYASVNKAATLFNRALTAAEVFSLHQNGIAESDKWGSQTALTSGTVTSGKKYRINVYNADDDFTNIGGTNVAGTEFTATGTTPTHWAHSSSLVQIGATLALEAEGIQPSPGQWLDSSSNKLHAWQPATGSSLTRYKNTFEIRGTNTWAGTHEAQSIAWATDASKAILPAGCYIDSIIGVITGATIEDIIIGDGSDIDRWVEVTTGLAAGTVSFTIANHISDGTNYEMVVDPDANFTGSIEWTIRGTILD
jgi:hypothetical protein